jgi:hypothetical protein
MSRLLPPGVRRSFLVTPETIIRWHRTRIRREWTYKRQGLPRLDDQVVELILHLAGENPRW